MSSTGTLHETLLRLRQTVEADTASIAPATTTRKRKSTELLATSIQVDKDGATDDDLLKMIKIYKDKAEECEQDVDQRQEDFVAFKKRRV